jgi:glycine cleavage system H protein
MSNIPHDLKYTATHEWVRSEGEGVYCIGISEHAQELLGDMVFVELPDVGDVIAMGDECAVAESVKAASDVYSPLSGEVVAINEELEDSPELINSDAYGDGWLFKVKIEDESELDDLMSGEEYAETIEEDE